MFDFRASLGGNTSAKGKVLYAGESDVPVTVFLGLPYAQPPVGELRFCPPQPQELWTGERDCTKYGGAPMQSLDMTKMFFPYLECPDVTSEDCLYLNVYTPNVQPTASLPVMVWIYGGGFFSGTSDIYDGTPLAGFHDVVVVTINYRLGAFGFLTTGDDVIPGNMGLLDQVEALKWVQKHISSFGGDPDNVTIFGESAGGISCSLHIVSQLTAGLFRRAILQSGPATSPFTLKSQQKSRTMLQQKVQDMGFTGSSSEELVAFLRSKSAVELVHMDPEFHMFGPVIDGNYIKDYPHNLYKEGKFQNVEIITGICSHEGYAGVEYNPAVADPNMSLKEDDLKQRVMEAIMGNYTENLDAIADAIYRFYFTDECKRDADLFRQRYVTLFGDCIFDAPNNQLALAHSVKAPVYVYVLAYRASYTKGEPWVGASHGHDIYHTFGLPFSAITKGVTHTEADKEFSKTLMKYWTNFAKTGNPNGTGLSTWSQFEPKIKSYLILKETPEEATDYYPERMQFWATEIQKLDKDRVYK